MNELLILDVGHGNAALLISQQDSAIFDAAPGTTLINAIEQRGLSTINHLFISHADNDHVGGVIALLSKPQFEVRNLYLNPDASKYGPQWNSLRIVVDDAVRRSALNIHVMHESKQVTVGETTIVALAPSPSNLLSGPSGRATDGTRLSSNSSSSVFALDHQNHRVVLFAGDMDESTLERMLAPDELNADILVYPHHGGSSGPNTARFAESLARLVQPRLTLFSIGRNKHQNPRPEVVNAVRKGCVTTHILCTQLSMNCATNTPDQKSHIQNFPSSGRRSGICCGGTVLVRLNGADSQYFPFSEHQLFVENFVPNALCKRIII